MSLETHSFTKLWQNVCLMNTLMYRYARCVYKSWNAHWFYCVLWVFSYIIDEHSCLKYYIFIKLLCVWLMWTFVNMEVGKTYFLAYRDHQNPTVINEVEGVFADLEFPWHKSSRNAIKKCGMVLYKKAKKTCSIYFLGPPLGTNFVFNLKDARILINIRTNLKSSGFIK